MLGDGLTLAGAGLVLGLLTSILVQRVLASLLFEVGAWDPIAFAGATILLLCGILGACATTVRRVARLDPVRALT